MRVEVFADIVCPLTHVGLRRLIQVREERGVNVPIRVHAWPLELVNGDPLPRDLVAREIDALQDSVAPELFTGFDTVIWPHTSIPALGLAASGYAHEDATGEAISLALRDALFERGLDITDMDVLRHLGAPYGVVPLDDSSALSAVQRDFERGKARLVRGSPHFFVGDENWFCPSLDITHEHGDFDIKLDLDTMREFYESALAR